MGTWVTCPYCMENLPRKYKNRKERKEIHQPTCNACQNTSARKAYEKAVKRGIWLKKWKRAIDSFGKAMQEFQTVGDTTSKLTVELMALMSTLNKDKNAGVAKFVLQELISGKYDAFLNQDFTIPEFREFDPLYFEAKGWSEYFKIDGYSNIFDKVNQMKRTSREFFNMGYGQLFFSSYLKNQKLTNVDIALRLEAESEEYLGNYYASIVNIDKASIHLNNAASAFLNLEEGSHARKLKMVRQSLRMETACWICGSRNRGYRQTFNFKYSGLPVNKFDNVMSQLKQRQERNPTLYDDTIYSTNTPIKVIEGQDVADKKNARGIYLSTCVTCQGLIDNLARDVVEEALKPVWKEIQTLQSQMAVAMSRISNLESSVSSLSSQISNLSQRLSSVEGRVPQSY